MVYFMDNLSLTLVLTMVVMSALIGGLVGFLLRQRKVSRLLEENVRLANALETELRVSSEKIAAMEQARGQLSDTFNAMAGEALKHNSTEFLKLAQENLKQFHVKAEGDLALREKAVADLVKPIHKALEKLPADRFSTAARFAEALSDTSLTMPATVTAIGVQGTAGVGPTWNRMTITLAAVATIASVVAVLGWMQPGPNKPVTRYRMTPADPDQSVDLVQRFGGNIALAPDDSRLAFLGLGPNLSQIYVRERNQLDARLIAGTGGATTPTFSPDGQRIAAVWEPVSG